MALISKGTNLFLCRQERREYIYSRPISKTVKHNVTTHTHTHTELNMSAVSGVEFGVRNPLQRKNITRMVEIFERLTKASNLGRERLSPFLRDTLFK
jgi:hypothetical protein